MSARLLRAVVCLAFLYWAYSEGNDRLPFQQLHAVYGDNNGAKKGLGTPLFLYETGPR